MNNNLNFHFEIEKFRQQVDIVSVINHYLPLKRSGRNYTAICPFHNDTTPSLSISTDKQIFKCFVCNKGGNVFTFVSEFEKIPFLEAVTKIASTSNLEPPISYNKEASAPKLSASETRYYELLDTISSFYSFNLKTDSANLAMSYLKSRGIDESVIEKYKIGFSPVEASKTKAFLIHKGFSEDELLESGVFNEFSSYHDRFNGRVIFPILNSNGKIVAFSGRIIDGSNSAKYINSPETKYFTKGDILYNMQNAKFIAKKMGKIYLVEGFMDAIALHRIGVDNAVATMGTALSAHQIKELKSLNAEIIVALDNDSAGFAAMLKIIDMLRENKLKCSVLNQNYKAKDLDELLTAKGETIVREALNKVISINEFRINYLASKVNFDNHSEKSDFINNIIYYLANETNEIELEGSIKLLSQIVDVTIDSLYKMITRTKNQNAKQQNEDEYYELSQFKNLSNRKISRYEQAQRQLIKWMIHSQETRNLYANQNVDLDPALKAIADYIVDYSPNMKLTDATLITIVTEEDPSLLNELTNVTDDAFMTDTFDLNKFNDVIKLINDNHKQLNYFKKHLSDSKKLSTVEQIEAFEKFKKLKLEKMKLEK